MQHVVSGVVTVHKAALRHLCTTKLHVRRDPSAAKTVSHHDDVIKWKYFPRYWPFVRRIHRWPVNSPHKGQWRGSLMFSLICAWINGWVNNREAGDLIRISVHYDVTVMITMLSCERHGVSCLRQLDCIFNNLLRVTTKEKHRISSITDHLLLEESTSDSESPHKGPVMRRAFPCHEKIMLPCKNILFLFQVGTLTVHEISSPSKEWLNPHISPHWQNCYIT